MDGLVLTAAGASTRFGGEGSKVLADLAGQPVIARALAPFRAVLHDLVVVVPARAQDAAAIAAALPGVEVVAGGATRQASVRNGLDALPADLDLIFVHDAARPLVTRAVVERVAGAARREGAAAAVLPVRETLHRYGDTDEVGPLLSPGVAREGLAQAQTPQAARADILRAAFAAAEADRFTGTDEVSLLLRRGVAVSAVAGTLTNIKITQAEDLELARRIVAPDA